METDTMTEATVYGTYEDSAVSTVPEPAHSPTPSVKSMLDEIRQDAKKSLERKITYEVTTREGYKLTFDANIDKDEVERWQRNAQGKKKRAEDTNSLQMASQALIESNVAIYRNDAKVVDRDGDAMTLNSTEWVEIWGGPALIAIRTFMGDGLCMSMGLNLLREAGYGDGTDLYAEDGEPDENPTRG
jgi:hypothetical protein